jgi:hypothetical protein
MYRLFTVFNRGSRVTFYLLSSALLITVSIYLSFRVSFSFINQDYRLIPPKLLRISEGLLY